MLGLGASDGDTWPGVRSSFDVPIESNLGIDANVNYSIAGVVGSCHLAGNCFQ